MSRVRNVVKADQKRFKGPKEKLDMIADFAGILDAGETISSISGTYEDAELGVSATPDGLTISDVQINTAGAVTVDGHTVAQNEGVEFSVKGGRRGSSYEISVVVRTSNDQVRQLDCELEM